MPPSLLHLNLLTAQALVSTTHNRIFPETLNRNLIEEDATAKESDRVADQLNSTGISYGSGDGATASSAPKEEVKRLPGGKVKKKEKPEVIIEKVTRNKRKSITTVKGLELFGVTEPVMRQRSWGISLLRELLLLRGQPRRIKLMFKEIYFMILWSSSLPRGQINPSFTPSELQNQDPPELQGFTAYDPQTGYNVPYYRPSTDGSVRGQDLPSQEVFSSHNANSIPSSTVSMVQQQPQHLAQMYPQVDVSHYANMMPLRQFIPPVYAPPMVVPIYSNNPAYPHMSNGNNFLLIPGGASHLNPNSLKYGVQQFKPIPAGSPTGFGNYTNSAGYAMNAPSLAGDATGLDDSSRIKYKDGNLYVPNQQIPNQRLCLYCSEVIDYAFVMYKLE